MVQVDNIREIYVNYMIMKKDRVKPYINSIAEQYGITYQTVMKKLENFVQTLSSLERSAYERRKESLKKYRIEKIQKLDFLTELNIECLKAKKTPAKYLVFLLNILNRTEKEGLEYLRKSQIDRKTYDKYVKQFEEKYPNQTQHISYLKRIYQKYDKDRQIPVICSKKSEESISTKLLNEVLNSEYCIEEYCAIMGESIYKLRKVYRCNSYIEEIATIYDIIDAREESKRRFDDLILNLIEKISTDELDIISYYEATKLNLKEFIDIAKKIVNDASIRAKIISFEVKYLKKSQMIMNKEIELDGKKIIGDRLIERDEKELVINYLEENLIPLGFYNIYLRSYLNGELDITGKTKVR